MGRTFLLVATGALFAMGAPGAHAREGDPDPTFGDGVAADGNVDTGFGGKPCGGWRGYTISDPTGSGQSGDYDQLHALAYVQGSALLFGRTFFEDSSNGLDYLSMLRVNFDAVFADGFECPERSSGLSWSVV